tara:strand:+ start:43016 stop:44038 length:1023 start_codon:yes stop_codon:yes gene_type:complete
MTKKIFNKIIDFHKNTSEDEYLNSYNFARTSDLVFAESITHEQFDKLNLIPDSYEIYENNENYLTYRLTKFEIKDGDVVFCKTDFIFELFTLLNKIPKKIKIILITHQAAQPSIDKSMFLLKPKSVYKWFSINVDYNHPELISIPLGLANDYSPKNVCISDLKGNSNLAKYNKKYLGYSNFLINTNQEKRKKIFDDYMNESWVYKNSNITKELYMDDIIKSKFVFTPPGWGIDTHRFWEVLYLGAIPIVEYSVNSSMFNMYPIVYYDINQTISEVEFSNNYENKLSDLDIEKLKISWWFKNVIRIYFSKRKETVTLKYGFYNKLIKRFLKIKYNYFKFRN